MNLLSTDKEFYGRITEQMPLLLAEGRTPMSYAQLMQRKLTAPKNLRPSYIDNYFHTGDALLYNHHPDGRFKVCLDSKELRGLTPQSTLTRKRALVLTTPYEDIDAPEFRRDEVILGRPLKKQEAKAHPVLQVLARDQHLLNESVDFIFSEAKTRFDYDENMGVYLADPQPVPTLGSWYVNRLDGRSNAGGYDDLDVDYGRLVGVAPEAPSLEDRVEVLSEGQVIKFQGRTYVLVPQDLLRQ